MNILPSENFSCGLKEYVLAYLLEIDSAEAKRAGMSLDEYRRQEFVRLMNALKSPNDAVVDKEITRILDVGKEIVGMKNEAR